MIAPGLSRNEPTRDHLQASLQRGRELLAAGEATQAVPFLEHAVRLVPEDPDSLASLGSAYRALARWEEAKSAYNQALMFRPDHFQANVESGDLLREVGESVGARGRYLAVRIDQTNSTEECLRLAESLLAVGEADAAHPFLAKASSLETRSATVLTAIGEQYARLGRFDLSTEVLERAIALQAGQAAAYGYLVDSKTVTEEDRPLPAAMQNEIATGNLSGEDLASLYNSLGKAFGDLRDYGLAMAHYDEANRLGELALRAKHGPFRWEPYIRVVDNLIKTFDRKLFESQRQNGSESEMPILIVGMLRSGTTLTEQILARHPEVGAAGEQMFWTDRGRQAGFEKRTTVPSNLWCPWIDKYLATLSKVAPGMSRVTDKNPGNYQALGLFHLCFPNAKIIHCRRHPIDNCLSIYMTRNSTPSEFACNRDNIVFRYRQYWRLMDHWRSVLPADRFLELDYEQLVSNPEFEIRRLVEFCGLEWRNECLDVAQGPASVVTPSFWQVRQSIYRSSTEKWRRYEPLLGSFRVLAESAS